MGALAPHHDSPLFEGDCEPLRCDTWQCDEQAQLMFVLIDVDWGLPARRSASRANLEKLSMQPICTLEQFDGLGQHPGARVTKLHLFSFPSGGSGDGGVDPASGPPASRIRGLEADCKGRFPSAARACEIATSRTIWLSHRLTTLTTLTTLTALRVGRVGCIVRAMRKQQFWNVDLIELFKLWLSDISVFLMTTLMFVGLSLPVIIPALIMWYLMSHNWSVSP
jgi:hypothetical protein